MRYLECETLPTGVEITAKDDINSVFNLSDPLLGVVVVSKHDIARMYGIAYPDKKHECCKTKFEQAISDTAEENSIDATETNDYFSNQL